MCFGEWIQKMPIGKCNKIQYMSNLANEFVTEVKQKENSWFWNCCDLCNHITFCMLLRCHKRFIWYAFHYMIFLTPQERELCILNRIRQAFDPTAKSLIYAFVICKMWTDKYCVKPQNKLKTIFKSIYPFKTHRK